jgi:hypothetical protein
MPRSWFFQKKKGATVMARKTTPTCYVCSKPFKKILRLRITLEGTEPAVWRLLEVPGCYSFWDLHVAITDAFGWLDYHLHEFEIANLKTGGTLRLGFPDEDGVDESVGLPPIVPDWKRKLSGLFSAKNPAAVYRYDFGDGWEHLVELEAVEPRQEGADYPRCMAGERAGPPDDCGGPWGYMDLLQSIRNPRRKDHREKVDWLRMMKGPGFDPAAFDPAAVHFDDPDQRWRIAYEDAEMTPEMRGWKFFRQSR